MCFVMGDEEFVLISKIKVFHSIVDVPKRTADVKRIPVHNEDYGTTGCTDDLKNRYVLKSIDKRPGSDT